MHFKFFNIIYANANTNSEDTAAQRFTVIFSK